jgi:hypothetical protein
MPVLQNDTAHHVFRISLGGDPELMVTSFSTQWDSGSEDLAAHVAAVADAFGDMWQPQAANNYTLQDCISEGRDASGDLFEAALVISRTGSINSDPVLQNSAVLIQKRSGVPGRTNRGRMYIPGWLFEGSTNPLGIIDAARVTTLQGLANTMWSTLDGATPQRAMVILHTPPSTEAQRTVLTLTVDNRVATQRRRLRP